MLNMTMNEEAWDYFLWNLIQLLKTLFHLLSLTKRKKNYVESTVLYAVH